MHDFPCVTTFYSYKGGVGRSMAVLNVGYLLASWGRNVLLVDMDLEAPGVSGFLKRKKLLSVRPKQDVVDFVQWATDWVDRWGAEPEALAKAAAEGPPRERFVTSVKPESFGERLRPRADQPGCLHVLAANEQRRYEQRLARLDLGNHDQQRLVEVARVMRAWFRAQRLPVTVPDYYGDDEPREEPYDYILVDARTGVTDVGGLCLGPLADRLVVCCGLNDQNIEGTARFLRLVGALDEEADADEAGHCLADESQPVLMGPKKAILVATPVPVAEIQRKRERLAVLRQRVGPVSAELSYHPLQSLFETVFVAEFPEEHLAADYRRLAHQLTAAVDDHPLRLAADLMPPPQPVLEANGALVSLRPDETPSTVPFRLEDPCAAATYARVIRVSRQAPLALAPVLWSVVRMWHWSLPCYAELDMTFDVLLDQVAPCSWTVAAARAENLEHWAMFSSLPEQRVRFQAAADVHMSAARWATDPAQHAQSLIAAGRCLTNCGALRQAAELCTTALEVPGISAFQRELAIATRGHVWEALGDGPAAIAVYSAALELHSAASDGRIEVLVRRAGVLLAAGNEPESLADLAEVLSLRTPTAAAIAKEFRRLWPTSPASRQRLAFCLLKAGCTDDALAEYRELLSRAEAVDGFVEGLQLDLPGAPEVLALIAARRAELESLDSDPPTA